MTVTQATSQDLAKDDGSAITTPTLEQRTGKCGGYKCECSGFVKGERQQGWPSCARPECLHTQHVHAFAEARALKNVKRQ